MYFMRPLRNSDNWRSVFFPRRIRFSLSTLYFSLLFFVTIAWPGRKLFSLQHCISSKRRRPPNLNSGLNQSDLLYFMALRVRVCAVVLCTWPVDSETEPAGALLDPVLGFTVEQLSGRNALDGQDDVAHTQIGAGRLAARGHLEEDAEWVTKLYRVLYTRTLSTHRLRCLLLASHPV